MPGKRPDAALRHGQRAGDGPQAAPESGAGDREAALHCVSDPESHSSQQAGLRRGGGCFSGSLDRRGRKHHAGGAGDARGTRQASVIGLGTKSSSGRDSREGRSRSGTRPRPTEPLRSGHQSRSPGVAAEQSGQSPKAAGAHPARGRSGGFARLGMAFSLGLDPRRRHSRNRPLQRRRVSPGLR